MVSRLALSGKWMFARHIDLADLEQAGWTGVVKAANAYDPAKVVAGQWSAQTDFERFAWLRVRGAIIDSQKRRAYREEQNEPLSLVIGDRNAQTAIEQIADSGLLPDEAAGISETRAVLAGAIDALPKIERYLLQAHLAGVPLSVSARRLGRSLTWARGRLAMARELVGVAMRGKIA